MIKRVALITLSLVFGFLVLGVSIFKTCAQTEDLEIVLTSPEAITVTEATISGLEGTESGELVAVEKKKESVDYYLPYPGLLPDHPLYFLKMIRDRIELFFTTQPLKKAEKLLLLSDKRIAAAQELIDKDKANLGLTTAAKAEGYLERAIEEEVRARENGQETRPFLEKLNKATQKHEEILLAIKVKTEGEEALVEELLEFSRQACQKVTELLNQ